MRREHRSFDGHGWLALMFGLFYGPRRGSAAAARGRKLARATSRTLLDLAALDSTSAPGHIIRVRSRTGKCAREKCTNEPPPSIELNHFNVD
jgi:hypothetical protein